MSEPGPDESPPDPRHPPLPSAPPLAENDRAQPARRGSLVAGIVAGLLLYALGFVVSTLTTRDLDGNAAVGLFFGLVFTTPILLLVGIVLVAIPRTRMHGAGLLLSISFGVLLLGGVCVVVVQSVA